MKQKNGHRKIGRKIESRRKPRLLFLLSGLLLFRLPTVQLFALLFQLPPRLTRLEPDTAPYKVHTVFNQKIFEPLKRLTQCRSFLFSKISCTASTHLCFGRCAVTGCLRCALHCLPAYAQMCELKGTKPGGSQDSRPRCQDCCRTVRLQCSCSRSNRRRDGRGKSLTRHLEDR